MEVTNDYVWGRKSDGEKVSIVGSLPNQENPFQTSIGQIVVTPEESFKSRLFRLGRYRSSYAQGSECAPGTITTPTTVKPSPGCILYPLVISVASDLATELMITFKPNVADAGAGSSSGTVFMLSYGTQWTLNLNGEVAIYEGGEVSIAHKNDIGVTTHIHGNIYGIEVITNA